MASPFLLHIDMDCFYAAVEMRDNPEIRNKPVIIGALPGSRGVIAACNYEARKFGLHSAMPIVKAVKLCPKGVYLRGDMEKYGEESEKVMAILSRYTDQIEIISIDEAFMEVSDLKRLFGSPETIGRSIKKTIREELGLTASVGGAPVKFVAKIASDLKKPDGLLIVNPNEVSDLLAPLPVSRLPGVGNVSNTLLNKLGITTIRSLRQYPLAPLVSKFGEQGAQDLKDLSNGLGYTDICVEREAKSVSREYTYQNDTENREQLRKSLVYLTDDVASRLRSCGLKTRTVHLTWRTSDFKRHTRQVTLIERTQSGSVLFKAVEKLFDTHLTPGTFVRLIGMGTSHFGDDEEAPQLSLFEKTKKEDGRHKKVDAARDKLSEKYGEDPLKRASLF